MSVWLSACRHVPDAPEERVGRAEPRTSATGFEKVRRSGVAGETAAPGGGLAATLGRLPAGNQVTGSGGLSRSHERAALAIRTVPAASRVPRLTELRGWANLSRCR